MGASEPGRLLIAGDVGVRRPDPPSIFAHVRDVLRGGDLTLVNQEWPLTDHTEAWPGKTGKVIGSPPEAVEALVSAGVDVVSLANNHMLNYGVAGLRQTLEVLDRARIAHAGAGLDFDAAHAPSILTCRGTRVAVLSYTSVFPTGWEAGPGKPGLATVRIDSRYTPYYRADEMPGVPYDVVTTANPDDAAQVEQDIRVPAEDAQSEAQLVAHQIGALLDRGLLEHPGDAAVLYRTNAQADALAAALRSAAVPYRMHAQADLFGERVVRDLIAYLRLAHNPADRVALGRIADRPRRGLHGLLATLLTEPATVAELPALASQFDPCVMAAAAGLTALVYQLHAWILRGLSPLALLDQVLDARGYGAWLDRRPDRTVQLEVLSRFRAVVQRAQVSLAEWLDALAMAKRSTQQASTRPHTCAAFIRRREESGGLSSWSGSKKASFHITRAAG